MANVKGEIFDLQFQQQQLIAVLKFLEYSGYYTKYQAHVLQPFYDNDLSKSKTEEYISLYVDYRYYKDISTHKDSKVQLEECSKKLKEIEKDYAYDKVAPIRNIAFNKHMVEKRKEEERKEIDQKGKQI